MGKRHKQRHKQDSSVLSISDETPKKRNVTVLSLDYDGCGDLLFEEASEKGAFKNNCDPSHEQYLQGLKSAINRTRSSFEDLLSIETTDADVVELFVGSARQNRELDRYNNSCNKNGLCFEMYADLAEKKHWHFNKMLLSDLIDDSGKLRAKPFKAGTAMGPLKKNKQGMYKYEEDTFADTLRERREACKIDVYKIVLLTQQIKAIIAKYPNDKIKFVFIDDRLDIMEALQNHFNLDNQLSSHADFEKMELRLIHHDSLEIIVSEVRAEQYPIVATIKKMIKNLATFPTSNVDSVNKKSIETIASQGLFSKSFKIHKAKECTTATNYSFICSALGLIGVCLAMLTIRGILICENDNESPEHEMTPSF